MFCAWVGLEPDAGVGRAGRDLVAAADTAGDTTTMQTMPGPAGAHGPAGVRRRPLGGDGAAIDVVDGSGAVSDTERLRAVVANAPVALAAFDTAGVCTLLEGLGASHLGGAAAVGSPLADAFDGLAALQVAEDVDATLAGGEPCSVVEHDGVSFEVRYQPVRVGGRVVGGLAVATDITEHRAAEASLRRSEARFRALVAHSADQTVIVDRDGTVTYASPSATPAAGTKLAESVHPDDRAALAAALAAAVDGPARAELRAVDGRGGWRTFEVIVTDCSTNPHVGGIVVNARDISDRRRGEDLLAAEARLLERVARGAPLDVIAAEACALAAAATRASIGARLRVVTGSQLYCDAGEVPAPDGADTDPLDGTAPSAAALSAHAEVTAAGGDLWVWAVPACPSPDRDHDTHCVLSIYSAEPADPDESARAAVSAAARIAAAAVDRDLAAERLLWERMHDPLTGLANRRLLLDRLDRVLARAEPGQVAVVALNLDEFKVVNVAAGHAAGDELLVAVARRLTAAVRPGDVVARFGADSFAVCFDSVASAFEAATLAEELRAAVAAGPCSPSVSAGVALNEPGATAETMLANADVALRRAKERGRARVELYDAALDAAVRDRLEMTRDLRHALERGELRLVYQPQVHPVTGVVVGAEALLRWAHPVRGLVGPDAFIPHAETSGLIVPIGNWVLGEACRQAAAWAAAGLGDLRVAVNLSARQSGGAGLAASVADHLAGSGLDPRQLCLEVTETALMEDPERFAETLERIVALGVSVAVDDFGAGWSSLVYLKHLPVAELKIDASFVRGLGVDAADEAIVAAIVELARSFQVDVVAEGVETDRQRARVAEFGVAAAQGFLWSPPLDAETFAGWLRARR